MLCSAVEDVKFDSLGWIALYYGIVSSWDLQKFKLSQRGVICFEAIWGILWAVFVFEFSLERYKFWNFYLIY